MDIASGALDREQHPFEALGAVKLHVLHGWSRLVGVDVREPGRAESPSASWKQWPASL